MIFYILCIVLMLIGLRSVLIKVRKVNKKWKEKFKIIKRIIKDGYCVNHRYLLSHYANNPCAYCPFQKWYNYDEHKPNKCGLNWLLKLIKFFN